MARAVAEKGREGEAEVARALRWPRSARPGLLKEHRAGTHRSGIPAPDREQARAAGARSCGGPRSAPGGRGGGQRARARRRQRAAPRARPCPARRALRLADVAEPR
ncbi:unnamed protein product [Prorocentrum cordatum]|uniref:Uncharacterized protein n=1 Tax=Prorocentrum cordatum TaxID=2364126 RepID=A0ABN9UDL5_9DINO|nr:unnamed protein product [Polarella glacialis]